MFVQKKVSKNEIISLKKPFLNGIELSVKREDSLHKNISGNKFRKLKYNLLKAKEENHHTLLTFGGAYSNHILAVANAGKEFGIKTIGVIRGEELKNKYKTNPTLVNAEKCGMQLHFVTRKEYSDKENPLFINSLQNLLGSFYTVPEGGTNHLAVKGCEEILTVNDRTYDYICVPVGTGGTISGLINSSQEHQNLIGYSALKGTFQDSEIKKYTSKTNYKILDDYCFGGYAKIDEELIRFINNFKQQTNILLDPIYTAKMFYGIIDGIKKGTFSKNSRILAIHTGGLQGIEGMNYRLKTKKLPQIEF